jgi:hypothetical protein
MYGLRAFVAFVLTGSLHVVGHARAVMPVAAVIRQSIAIVVSRCERLSAAFRFCAASFPLHPAEHP